MRLYDFYILNQRRSIIKNAHYFPIYERHFSKFVGHDVVMFEIGTGRGGSALMWKNYFGPQARIVTVDIVDNSEFTENQIYPRRGSQADPEFLLSLVQEFGRPDIVLDDGSHMMDHIKISFETLFPHTESVYLVEDLDGAYWEDRNGGLGHPNSFIEIAKQYVDKMNRLYVRDVGFDHSGGDGITSISFYPMIVALEKARYENRLMARMPPGTE